MANNQAFPYQRHVNPDVNGNVVCGSAKHNRFKVDPISQKKIRQTIGELSRVLGGCDDQAEATARLKLCEMRLRRILSKI